MMLTAPRFIVVDDKEAHLRAIVSTFQELGSPCLGVQYVADKVPDKTHFRGVRCLFLDLHLIDSTLSSDNKKHFGLIASFLEDNISASGGPFLLVIWTEHPHHKDDLKEYLYTNLAPDKAHARPIDIIAMDKTNFINTTTGAAKHATDLHASVRDALEASPQLAALLSWETGVLTAAAETLAALLGLVPEADGRAGQVAAGLDKYLSLLAKESVGQENVDADPRSAVIAALAPILGDRIINQPPPPGLSGLWAKAVTRHKDATLRPTALEAGQLNRMLHVAKVTAERVVPTTWGAVVDWPYPRDDAGFRLHFGMSLGELLGGEFKIEDAGRAGCTPVLVRVGAACDYAQTRSGPVPYLLGFEVPETAPRKVNKKDNNRPLKPPEAVWISPVLLHDQPGAEPCRLQVHTRFCVGVPEDATAKWTPRYRLREQLLMHLIQGASTYASRLGLVTMNPK